MRHERNHDVTIETRAETPSTLSAITLASMTRRALIAIGGLVATGFTALSTAGKKKKRKKRKKKGRDAILVALNMTGAKEVDPNPGDPGATGSATFTIKANGTICAAFTFQTSTPGSVVQMTHIHEGDATVNGPIVVDFHGQLNECVPIASDLANRIKANPAGFYANIHTNLFTGGAARDQLTVPA